MDKISTNWKVSNEPTEKHLTSQVPSAPRRLLASFQLIGFGFMSCKCTILDYTLSLPLSYLCCFQQAAVFSGKSYDNSPTPHQATKRQN